MFLYGVDDTVLVMDYINFLCRVFSSKWKGEGGQSNASFIPWIIEMYYY